ncbi:hypothetical protein ABH927_003860 [Planotetraspora sp. GP83]
MPVAQGEGSGQVGPGTADPVRRGSSARGRRQKGSGCGGNRTADRVRWGSLARGRVGVKAGVRPCQRPPRPRRAANAASPDRNYHGRPEHPPDTAPTDSTLPASRQCRHPRNGRCHHRARPHTDGQPRGGIVPARMPEESTVKASRQCRHPRNGRCHHRARRHADGRYRSGIAPAPIARERPVRHHASADTPPTPADGLVSAPRTPHTRKRDRSHRARTSEAAVSRLPRYASPYRQTCTASGWSWCSGTRSRQPSASGAASR